MFIYYCFEYHSVLCGIHIHVMTSSNTYQSCIEVVQLSSWWWVECMEWLRSVFLKLTLEYMGFCVFIISFVLRLRNLDLPVLINFLKIWFSDVLLLRFSIFRRLLISEVILCDFLSFYHDICSDLCCCWLPVHLSS